jgi:required for meiotic nuclear division protein 1
MDGVRRALRTNILRANARPCFNPSAVASASRHHNRWFLFTRPFSASADAEPSEAPKHKPKASTTLRRTASASIPIRSNPTPTRSSIRPVLTLATAERYLLLRLRSRLPGAQTLHDALWVPHWGDGGEVFVFSNGSFVSWGLGEGEAQRFAREVLAPSEVNRLKEPETEELEFVTDPTECVLS